MVFGVQDLGELPGGHGAVSFSLKIGHIKVQKGLFVPFVPTVFQKAGVP